MIDNKDLIEDEFYYSFEYGGHKDNNYILKWNNSGECFSCSCHTNIKHQNVFYPQGDFTSKVTRLATSEEKHHLKICIESKKYIKYNEAMKYYIKPIEPTIQDDPNLGEILIKLLS